MSTELIHIGVLGTARITPAALIKPARAIPGLQIGAVASRDPLRAARFARLHGIPKAYGSYGELIQDPQLQAIYNPLPNALHGAWSIPALQAGKHVLCEKPMAANAAEAATMAEAADRAGRWLVEAFHYRYHPLAHRLQALIQGGEIGAIKRIESSFIVPLIIPNHINYSYPLGGGATMDVGCYPINLLRFLVGNEPRVTAASPRLISPQIDREMSAELEFPGGITGRVECGILSWKVVRAYLRVWGDAGELEVMNPFQPHRWHSLKIRRAGQVRSEQVRGETTYYYQLKAFVEAIRKGESMATSARDAVANMAVIDAIYEKAGLAKRGPSAPPILPAAPQPLDPAAP